MLFNAAHAGAELHAELRSRRCVSVFCEKCGLLIYNSMALMADLFAGVSGSIRFTDSRINGGGPLPDDVRDPFTATAAPPPPVEPEPVAPPPPPPPSKVDRKSSKPAPPSRPATKPVTKPAPPPPPVVKPSLPPVLETVELELISLFKSGGRYHAVARNLRTGKDVQVDEGQLFGSFVVSGINDDAITLQQKDGPATRRVPFRRNAATDVIIRSPRR